VDDVKVKVAYVRHIHVNKSFVAKVGFRFKDRGQTRVIWNETSTSPSVTIPKLTDSCYFSEDISGTKAM